MHTTEQLLTEFKLFRLETGGLGNWINETTDAVVLRRLCALEENPISRAQLNQLLVFGHEAPLTDDFFQYYWLKAAASHPYNIRSLPDFDNAWEQASAITSLRHLRWGLYRIFVDGLLWFGNIRTAYRALRSMNAAQLVSFFEQQRFDARAMEARGAALPLEDIARDDRYLIAEMACKSYGDESSPSDLRSALVETFRIHQAEGGGAIKIRDLLSGRLGGHRFASRQQEFIFSADDVLEESVATETDLEEKFDAVASKFRLARDTAMKNTRLYLSMVGDLDAYVATSMRTRQDFRGMASTCETIFNDERLRDLHLRYFDPTLSAASGHEDKGLIECLMVKCAKVLVLCAGERDSFGKDAEAAMALSLGKPVIIYCSEEQRRRFFRDVHPLSRLIDFSTGVAVGAMVTDSPGEVAELLRRIFLNEMEYELEQPKNNYLRLKEKLTGSVVRLQTSDQMLSETFWNHYHNIAQRKNFVANQSSL